MSRITSSRISVLAFATALVIGSMVTAVEAAGRHGGGGRGGGGGGRAAISHGFSGGGGRSFSGFRSSGINRSFGVHRGIGRSFRVGRGYGYRHRFRGGYNPYYYSGYRGCYRWRRVLTPYGWHVRRINVCYRPYYHRYRLYGF